MNDNKLPKRKKNRLDGYDYSKPGAYFLTLCTFDRKNYFWDKVNATIDSSLDISLTMYGKIVDEAINKIPQIYPSVSLEHYVIMPDHIHILLTIHADNVGRPIVTTPVERTIQQMKGYVTKRIGYSIWQKLFADHIIRNQQDYDEHVKYIYENPIRWYYDKLISD